MCIRDRPHSVSLVVTEGNYLLVDDGPWGPVRGLLDEVWFLRVPEAARLDWLVARHVAGGKHPDAARAWALGSDQRNAALIACLLYTSPSPRDRTRSRMPSS